MQRACEVCSGLAKIGAAPEDHPRKRVRRVLVDDRIVVLCDPHAVELKESTARDLDALREKFMEPGGQRSLLDRRAPLDRRIFPPRPEGRRRGEGRRHDDVE